VEYFTSPTVELSNYTSSSSLLECRIALPLWKEIIEFLQNEKETLKHIRLVCKYFRNLISFIGNRLFLKSLFQNIGINFKD
jgi:hypothetical protein